MPRNDQHARQWHILRRLEGRRGVTLRELAAALPDDLPKHLRTLRRDLEALEAGGYPLQTERVDGQTRWRLMDGARAPAIGFSATELMALAVSRDLLRPLRGTDHAFQLPLGFDVAEYLGDALMVMHGPPVALELVFDKATAAWARDRLWHPSQRLEALPGGRLRMTLRVADTRELLGWILSFGRGVRVVRPAQLRDRVRAEALALSRQ
jgi:predicted DNA-binding transcriptional regulator YafY